MAAMAKPEDDSWLVKLLIEYAGKILYGGGSFRVFDILYVPNKGSKTGYSCWEAISEPFHGEDGQWVVHEWHLPIVNLIFSELHNV